MLLVSFTVGSSSNARDYCAAATRRTAGRRSHLALVSSPAPVTCDGGRWWPAGPRSTFERVRRDTGFPGADAQDDFQRARRRQVMSQLARRLSRDSRDVDVILPF